jgi:Protein of unknown function, DUF547
MRTSSLLTRIALLGIVLLLGACSTLVATPPSAKSDDAPSASAASQAWSRVLQAHVNERGLVDFAALAKAPQDLHTMIRFVANVSAQKLGDKNTQLAHHINAYNALSMFNVIDSGIPHSNAGLTQRYKFFIARKHTIGGQVMSLYDYENKVIRAFGESRIHWALNCSALSCPVLPREPFDAANLEAQLERESKKFFASERNLRVDHAARAVLISEIFKFFPEDFVPSAAPNLITYINRYAPQRIEESFTVQFIPYDWTITNWRR